MVSHLATAPSPASASALAWQVLALVLLVLTVAEHSGRGAENRAGGDVQKHHIGGKPGFVTGRARQPIVPVEMIAKGRMSISSDGGGGLEKSELPLCRAFILPTAPVPNHQAVGFDFPPNGGLSTIWTGGFEALHCLTSHPSLASLAFFLPYKVLQPCQGKGTIGTSLP